MHRFDDALGCTKADVVGGSWHSGSDIAMSMQCTARLREALSCSKQDVCNTVYGEAKYPAAAGALYVSVGEGALRDARRSTKMNGQISDWGPCCLPIATACQRRIGSGCR
jgi:hypothetical protein